MKRFFVLLLIVLVTMPILSQTVVQMVEDKGVYKIPCEINGLKVKMVFDTGAAAVTISQSFAEMMLDNNYLSISDFIGTSKSMVADGRIVDHAELILNSLKIDDIEINDVKAIVVNSQNAPLLLGQTAIQKFGDISIKGDKLFINSSSNKTFTSSIRSHFEKWDGLHYIYSNYTYGFGWNLPKDYKWERVEGNEKHTVFRAQGGPFLVFVNARVAGNSVDLWKAFKQHTSLLVKLDASYEKRTGVLIYEREFEKCTLLGQHAIKTKFKEYFKDSRYDKPVETYAEEYMVIINGYFLTIALKIPKELYDTTDCRDEISKVFQGFRYSVKH